MKIYFSPHNHIRSQGEPFVYMESKDGEFFMAVETTSGTYKSSISKNLYDAMITETENHDLPY